MSTAREAGVSWSNEVSSKDPSQGRTNGPGAMRWPNWFSSHGATDGTIATRCAEPRSRKILRLGQVFGRFIVLLVGVSIGMHVALAALVGADEIARKTAIDPLGMIVASCVVTPGLLLTSFCYEMLRNRLTSPHASKQVFGFWYGFVYAITMTFLVAGLSQLFQWTFGPEVRQSLPTEIDFVFLALAMVFAAVICIEHRRLWRVPSGW